MAVKTLYKKRGRTNVVALVVDLDPNHATPEPRGSPRRLQMPQANSGRTLWIVASESAPVKAGGKDANPAPSQLHVSSVDFDDVGAEIGRALTFFNIAPQDIEEVRTAIMAHKAEVVGTTMRRARPKVR